MPDRVTVSEWADRHRLLSPETSAAPGEWKTRRTPYLAGIMDAILDRDCQLVVIAKSTQVGGSEAILNQLGYVCDQDPGPAMIVYPTIDLARSFAASRLHKMFEASPVLTALIPANRDLWTLQEMHLPGMMLNLAGANSAASLASRPVRWLWCDEINKFPAWVGSEADPISLARERQRTFWNRRTVLTSTPTLPDVGISRELDACDEVRDYQLPCLSCGALAVMDTQQIRWPEELDREADDYPLLVRDSSWWECPACKARAGDEARPAMLAGGRWVARSKSQKPPKAIGFQLSAHLSPWLRWGEIAEEWVRSKGTPEKLQNFTNSWEGKPWVQEIGKVRTSEVLAARLEVPARQAPDETIAVVATIDVQKHGFWFLVRAHGSPREGTSWLLDFGWVDSWDALDELVFSTRYQTAGGRDLGIWRCGIDTGGGLRAESGASSAEEVLQWVRLNSNRGPRLFACKGSSTELDSMIRPGSVIDRTPRGKALPGGVQLWRIDTDRAKDSFVAALAAAARGEPGGAYLNAETDDRYARQITAEEKRRERKTGREFWHHFHGRDNHALDLEAMQRAIVHPGCQGGIARLRRPSAPQALAAEADAKPKPPTPNPFLSKDRPDGGNPFLRRW